MFLFYYIWGFFFFIVAKTNSFVEDNFLVKNNPFLNRKRTFKFISYFEKIFLVFFYKKGWFEKSIANLYRKNDIIDHRRKNYPLINAFHLYYEKMDYKFNDLKFLIKQFNFYHESPLFKIKLNRIYRVCFKNKNLNFLKYLMIQNILIDKYYNCFSSNYFSKYNELNFLKLNFVFNVFLIKAEGKFIVFDLSKWEDWYSYLCNKKVKKYYKLRSSLLSHDLRKIRDFRKNKIKNWIKMVSIYKKNYNLLNKFFLLKRGIIIFFRFNFLNFFKLRINNDFKKLIHNYYMVRFNESSVTKFILPGKIKNYSFFYLRKNRIFNKGRYSRNRQLYRTGVYWCLWLNIIMVYGLYFIFYRFSFNFGYIWWGVLILAYSTIFSRILKYNFHNLYYVYKEFNCLKKWYGYLILNFIDYIKTIFSSIFVNINLFNFIFNYSKSNYYYIFTNFYYYLSKFLHFFLTFEKNVKINFLWQGMKEKDTSFLRYKTFIHWINQLYKLITTK